MKSIFRKIFVVLAELLSMLNQFIPKNNNMILFYTNPTYNDNVRALFQWCAENLSQQDFILYSCVKIPISGFAKNIFFISRIQGFFVFLRARFVFYDVGTTRIRPSAHQMVVQLWHGTPLKRIGRSVSHYENKERLNAFSFVITTSKAFKQVFSEAFECPLEKVVVSGYPRNDFLFSPARHIVEGGYKRRVLWMPTFRQSLRDGSKDAGKIPCGISMFRCPDDLYALDAFLQRHEVFLAIKHHPLSVQNNVEFPEFRNIQIINNASYRALNVQNYSFVATFDCLITDYSSVYFDYLLLNRPIGFVVEDIERYRDTRGFTFENPLEMMPGAIIQTKDDFLAFISSLDAADEYESRRLELRDLIHSKVQDNSACERILRFVGIEKEPAHE